MRRKRPEVLGVDLNRSGSSRQPVCPCTPAASSSRKPPSWPRASARTRASAAIGQLSQSARQKSPLSSCRQWPVSVAAVANNRKEPNPGATILLIFRRAFDMASGSEIFLDGVVRTTSRLELDGAAKPETDTFGHEPALVARCCSPAKLLGFAKLVGTPRCSDARRCHQCDWHSQGGPAAMASCRTSEQLHRVSRLTRLGCNDRRKNARLIKLIARAHS
jgi:hypothetical protein